MADISIRIARERVNLNFHLLNQFFTFYFLNRPYNYDVILLIVDGVVC